MQTPRTHSLNGDNRVGGGGQDDKATGQAVGDGRVGTRETCRAWWGDTTFFFYYTTLNYNYFYWKNNQDGRNA